jgi:hypothetical protein
MLNKKIVTIAVTVTLCTGCETMLSHYRLSESFISRIAMGNAGVNYCLSQNAINKNLAYIFNNASAQVLDISVLDRDLYKRSYEENLAKLVQDYRSPSSCAELETMLPKMNEYMINSYSNIASSLNQSRTEERQQMAAMASNLGRSWGSAGTMPNYATTYSWPKLNYVEQPEAANYLVTTSKGLVQCRVTNKNYVFCL